MSCMYLDVEPRPGSGFVEVAEKALRLARQLDVYVRYSFNGFTVVASPRVDDERSLHEQYEAGESKVIAGGRS